MIVYNRNVVQVALLSSVLIMIPTFYFPAKFGMDLARGSFTYSMFEIAFYGTVFFFIRPGSSLLQLFAGAGLTFLYRVFLGTMFGGLLSIIYGMDFSISLALGVSRYLPAIILHIVASPFVMRPSFLALADGSALSYRNSTRAYRTSVPDLERGVTTQPYLPKSEHKPKPPIEEPVSESKPTIPIGKDINGFERAVRYLGEHQAVLIATVIDKEGLTMAAFRREDGDPEGWAPLSLLFQQANEKLLDRNEEKSKLNHLDLAFGTKRLVIARVSGFNLLVLCKREEDELLNVRIIQASDIIRKYSSERYGNSLPASTEEQYVSNT